MSDHLPECPRRVIPDKYAEKARGLGVHAGDCICDALRACEQRVRDEHSEPDAYRGWVVGYAAGLDAAREAVEAIRDALQTHYRIDCEPVGEVDWSQHQQCDPVDDILAAIDAIRDKP